MGFEHGLPNIRIRNNIVAAKHTPRFVTTNFGIVNLSQKGLIFSLGPVP